MFSVPAAAQQIMLGPQLQAPGGGGSSHALAGSGRRLLASQPTTISASLQPGPGQVGAFVPVRERLTGAGVGRIRFTCKGLSMG